MNITALLSFFSRPRGWYTRTCTPSNWISSAWISWFVIGTKLSKLTMAELITWTLWLKPSEWATSPYKNNKVRKQWPELTVLLIMVLKCSSHDIFGALKKREKFMKTENREHFILPLGIRYSCAKLVKVHQTGKSRSCLFRNRCSSINIKYWTLSKLYANYFTVYVNNPEMLYTKSKNY